MQDIRLAGRTLRMFVAPVAQATGPASGGAVLVAADTTDIGQTLSSLGVVVALSGVGVVLLAALAAALLTRRGLRPLRELAGAAGEIERTADPAQRLPEPAGRDEIARLTGVLNRMLSALEAARAGERRFLADASHELRTPVTSLLGNVEYAARHGADAEVLAELRHDAAAARAPGRRAARGGARERRRSAATSAVDIAGLVRAAVAETPDDRVRVREPLAAATVSGDAEALRRAVLNLIENGLIHGPPQGAVSVGVTATAQEVVITVTDEGPGPDPADRDHLFERFWRAPGAAERPGSGLGLPIVAATAGRHGGTVTVQGSAFALRLPRRE